MGCQSLFVVSVYLGLRVFVCVCGWKSDKARCGRMHAEHAHYTTMYREGRKFLQARWLVVCAAEFPKLTIRKYFNLRANPFSNLRFNCCTKPNGTKAQDAARGQTHFYATSLCFVLFFYFQYFRYANWCDTLSLVILENSVLGHKKRMLGPR